MSARYALLALGLMVLLASMGISIANVALPALAAAFGASFQEVQWIVLAYLLAVTTLIVGAGRLGDIAGRRRLLLAGTALFTLASLGCAVAPSLGLLIAGRAVQGVGAAVMMALGMAFVGNTVARSKAGSAMGLLGTMSAVGTALGPSLGGLLLAGPGWRAIFLVSVPAGLVAFALAWRHLPADPPRVQRDRAGFDAMGMALLALALGAYALAMTLSRGGFGLVNIALLLAAALGAGLFVAFERHAKFPLVPLVQLADPVLGAGLVMSGLISTVIMATLVVGPFYLTGGLGLDTALAGAVLSVGPVVSALTGVPAGRLVDRFGPHRVTQVGLVVMVTGCLLLALLPAALGVAGYAGSIAATTAGYALFQAANTTAVMADLPGERRGVVAGLLNLSRNLGLVTGVAAMGGVFALAAMTDVTAAAPETIASAMRITFLVAALLVAVALVIARIGAGRRPLSRA